MEDIGKAKTCGIKGIVISGPDIQAQHQHCQIKQVQADHDFKNVIASYEDGGYSAEEEHQGVADKESNHGGHHAGLCALCKAGEVRCCCSAGDEGAYYQACAADHGQGSAGSSELIDDGAVSLVDCHHHGHGAQDCHQGNRHIADDGQGINTEIGRGCHAHAGQYDQAPHGSIAAAQQFLGYRDGEHGKADAEPSDLGKADHGGGQIGALHAEGTLGQKV